MIRQVQPKPVSIGVSGAWGVGKSSLIKLLRKELMLDNSKPGRDAGEASAAGTRNPVCLGSIPNSNYGIREICKRLANRVGRRLTAPHCLNRRDQHLAIEGSVTSPACTLARSGAWA